MPTSPSSRRRSALAGPVDLVAFACELAMLVTLAVAGTGLGHSGGLHIALGVALPVTAAAVWGTWLAPRGRRRLADPARMVVQVVLFAATGGLSAAAGRPGWGFAFTVVAITAFLLTRVTGGVTESASSR